MSARVTAWMMVLLIVPSAHAGFDPYHLTQECEKRGEKIVDGVPDIGGAAKAIKKEIDNICEGKLSKFLEDISGAIVDMQDHAALDYAEVMAYAMDNITKLFNDTMIHVQEIQKHTTEEIVEAMDDFVTEHVAPLVAHVMDGVNQVLTRVEQDVQHIECEEQGVLEQLALFITQSLGSLNCECALKVKTEWAQPCQCSCSDVLPAATTCHCDPSAWVAIQDQIAFEYMECASRAAFESGTVPVGHVISDLESLRSQAEQLRCYHAVTDGSEVGIMTKKYTQKITDLSQEIFIWRNATFV